MRLIVKVILHKNDQEMSIWNEEGDRLWYSDKPADIEYFKKIMTVKKAFTPEELRLRLRGDKVKITYEVRSFGYFVAKMKDNIPHLVARAEGVNW